MLPTIQPLTLTPLTWVLDWEEPDPTPSDFAELFRGMPAVLSRDATLVMECPAPPVRRTIRSFETVPNTCARRACGGPMVYLPGTPEVCEALGSIAQQRGCPCIHCSVILGTETIMEAHDFASNVILFAPTVPLAPLRQLAERLRRKLAHPEM